MIRYDLFLLPSEAPNPSDCEIGTAKDRFTANAAYQNDDVRLTFTGAFVGKSSAADQYEFFACIDNLLDKDAPNILSGVTGNVTGSDTAADVSEVFGRRCYAGIRLKLRRAEATYSPNKRRGPGGGAAFLMPARYSIT